MMRHINLPAFDHQEKAVLALLKNLDRGLRHLGDARLGLRLGRVDLSLMLVLHVAPVEDSCNIYRVVDQPRVD